MVGDTVWDLEMAARAGVESCAVTGATSTASASRAQAPPTCSIDSRTVLDLLQTVAR